jgi:HSP20 family molecular chaperone IbpA
MTTLVPTRLAELVDWFDDGFPFGEAGRARGTHMIRVEDRVSDHDYELRAELPGLDPATDMQVMVDAGTLTIHAERHETTKSNGRSEFKYGRFDRSVSLPRNADADHITASYDSGVLTVTVPLTEPKPAGKKIAIGTNSKEIGSIVTQKPRPSGNSKGAAAK